MKAEELRIGNILYLPESANENYSLPDKFVIVTAISERRCNWKTRGEVDGMTLCSGSTFDDLNPVSITEEWLQKFGFGRSEEHEMGHNIGEIGFYYDYHFKRLTIDTGQDMTELKHFQHVHQLQNLYFALTGNELTVEK